VTQGEQSAKDVAEAISALVAALFGVYVAAKALKRCWAAALN